MNLTLKVRKSGDKSDHIFSAVFIVRMRTVDGALSDLSVRVKLTCCVSLYLLLLIWCCLVRSLACCGLRSSDRYSFACVNTVQVLF